MSKEIKPCPFCGGKGIPPKRACFSHQGVDDGWHVACENMYRSCMAQSDYCDTPEKAIEAWNRRASGWLRIEDKHKDGSTMLIGWYNPDGKWTERRAWWDAQYSFTMEGEEVVYKGAWTDDAVLSFGYEETHTYDPSHCMPLPDAPEGGVGV